MNRDKLSAPQLAMLKSIADGKGPLAHLSGAARGGGCSLTLASLYRRKLIVGGQGWNARVLTEDGIRALERAGGAK
jgi:mevalonate kinase